nr:hypothetical protein [Tanacetum cinerariifolium]
MSQGLFGDDGFGSGIIIECLVGDYVLALIHEYGSDLLILSAYAHSMPPLLSLLLSMACDDSDGCVTMVIGSYAVKQANRLKLSRILAGHHEYAFAAMAARTLFYPAHAFAVVVSIATFSFTVMVTRMGYLAMMEYNYGLDPGYQPVAFLGEFMQEFWRVTFLMPLIGRLPLSPSNFNCVQVIGSFDSWSHGEYLSAEYIEEKGRTFVDRLRLTFSNTDEKKANAARATEIRNVRSRTVTGGTTSTDCDVGASPTYVNLD